MTAQFGTYGRLRHATGIAVSIAGFSSPGAVKGMAGNAGGHACARGPGKGARMGAAVTGGLVFATLILIWFTSAYWFFSNFGIKR